MWSSLVASSMRWSNYLSKLCKHLTYTAFLYQLNKDIITQSKKERLYWQCIIYNLLQFFIFLIDYGIKTLWFEEKIICYIQRRRRIGLWWLGKVKENLFKIVVGFFFNSTPTLISNILLAKKLLAFAVWPWLPF